MKKTKKVPLRMCVVTKNMFPKSELIRIVKTEQNSFVVDKTGKINGRGVYVHKSPESVNKCLKQKSLHRAFKCNVSDDVYNLLLEDVSATNN